MKAGVTFLFILSCLISVAQAPLVKMWDKRFGGTNQDFFNSFQQTTDGGYILGGLSGSDSTGDKTQLSRGGGDYWIVKTDSVGNKIWDKRYGGSGSEHLTVAQQTLDGGYILGGFSHSGISGDKTESHWGSGDYWIVKVDSLGIKQWDKRFGGTKNDELYCLQQTKDAGYIMGGKSLSGISGDKTEANWDTTFVYGDYWVVKVDSLGIKQWDKRYGGSQHEILYALLQTQDRGYILGGTSSSGISGDRTQAKWGGSSDYWIVKIDSFGIKQWDKRFGGTGDDEINSMLSTNDGGYILAGTSFSDSSGDKTTPRWGFNDYWIVKVNSIGTKEWEKSFGATNKEELFSIVKTKEGGYLISGDSYSNASGDKSENNLGLENTWIIKTDSLCNKQWEKTIFTTGHDEVGLTIQTKDGCYVTAQCSNAQKGGDKTEDNWETSTNLTPIYDYWMIKFCDTTLIISGIDNLSEEDVVSIYPNPSADGSWNLEAGSNLVGGTAEVFDADGRVVFKSEIGNPKSEIALSASRGVYLLRICSAKSSVVRKLVRL